MRLAFIPPVVVQIRNSHNYLADFDSEGKWGSLSCMYVCMHMCSVYFIVFVHLPNHYLNAYIHT